MRTNNPTRVPEAVSVWTVVCSGNHVGHFGNVYHSYGTPSRTAFEVPAPTETEAARIVTNAGLAVLYVFE